MTYSRTIRFAGIQAKLRARIGRLPDRHTWSTLALEPVAEPREGLDGAGVGFWIEGLPQNVSRDGLERHFLGRIRALLARIAHWLPRQWIEFGDQLVLAPDVFWVAPVLAGDDLSMRLDPDSLLQEAARAAPEQRRGILEHSPFAPFLDGPASPEDLWRDGLVARIPRLPRAERRPVDRLLKVLEDYLHEKHKGYQQHAGPPDNHDTSGVSSPGEWRHHRVLEEKLYVLLAGDPFHPALILIYALLELLTMEKLRALLLCRLLGWTPPAALTGRA